MKWGGDLDLDSDLNSDPNFDSNFDSNSDPNFGFVNFVESFGVDFVVVSLIVS